MIYLNWFSIHNSGSSCSKASLKNESNDGKKSLSGPLQASKLFGFKFHNLVNSGLKLKTKTKSLNKFQQNFDLLFYKIYL